MKVNKRNIASILRESIFSPRDDELLSIVADVGNYEYYLSRALEEINKAKTTRNESLSKGFLTNAISILALAKLALHEKVRISND